MIIKVIFSLLIFSLTPMTFAFESIGRVIKVHGHVVKFSKGQEVPLNKGDHLFVSDKIVSGKASLVKFIMKDDTIFQLGPKSEFSFKKFDFKTKSDRAAIYNLVRGKLRSLFTVKAKTRSLKIITPTSSMAIRGTEILSDVFKYKGVVTTNIALLSGKLEIQSRGSKKKIMIKPGYVYQSSLDKQLKDIARRISVKRMDKRVFNRAKNSQNKNEIFLHDIRRKVDKNLIKDIKFEKNDSSFNHIQVPKNKKIDNFDSLIKTDSSKMRAHTEAVKKMKRHQVYIKKEIEFKRKKDIDIMKQNKVQPSPHPTFRPPTISVPTTNDGSTIK